MKPGQPVPHAAPVAGAAEGARTSVFRVTRWVALPVELDQLRYRKAVVAMSVGAVDRRWLVAEAGLRRAEVDALLQVLEREGALQVLPALPPSPIDSFERPPAPSGFMPRLRHWLQGGGIAAHW